MTLSAERLGEMCGLTAEEMNVLLKEDEVPSANEYRSTSQEKYRKYQKEKYTPEPHYQREE